MKGSRWFILAMVLFLAVMFLVEYNLPKKFVWNPTFSRYDYQPFGCAIFDDVLTDSWPGDYYLNGLSIILRMIRRTNLLPYLLLPSAFSLRKPIEMRLCVWQNGGIR